MYDKLGEMLNEVLKSGKIPLNKENITDDRKSEAADAENSGHFILKNDEINAEKLEKSEKSGTKYKKTPVQPGEIIKMHKYTFNMQFPLHIQTALNTLDIAYPFTKKDISKQYHKLLKQNHPDTKNTIQFSENVQNNRQYSIDQLTFSYAILCDFFAIK